MRLTLSTLPQLAVLAKILCLLMVMMCGAVPAKVSSVSLYSACSSENITVMGRMLKTSPRTDDTAPFQLLRTVSNDLTKKLYIYAEKSQRYICFNKNWKPVALLKKQRNARCQFFESFSSGHFRYLSSENPNYKLGFNKFGRPIKNQRAREECYNFIKFSSESLPERMDRHNTLLNAARSIIEDQEMQQDPVNTIKSSSRPHSQHRAKKNFIQADEAPREAMITTTSHRHRHTNRLKHDDVPSPRRRHHQSRLHEASKY